jgi:hypothetical protein
MEILPKILGVVAGSGLIYLFIGLHRCDESPLSLTFKRPLMLILELEQNALLLYSR